MWTWLTEAAFTVILMIFSLLLIWRGKPYLAGYGWPLLFLGIILLVRDVLEVLSY